ncbi:hypothetical protein M5W68_14485 [Paenibacillus larvae]|uniref:hypothetical protein n=1 Tax=Paenibacillus larvae TaxID=1464 RepID=UPI002280A3A7|nr:hypothetical protein [Paenibacillus larvae]MCY9510927.1 hypothetical protein [Paenibacillus larvae]MCY9526282.1 hypothetical protein [Paenibacillus larvae]
MKKLENIYIEKRAEEVMDLLCKESKDFYKAHTKLVLKIKDHVPKSFLKELLQLEDMYNSRINLAAETFKQGFREGREFKE